jgi:hypothetical protein
LVDIFIRLLGKIKYCKFRKAIGIYNLEDAKILVVVVDLSIK